jgi:hypothetical protein
MVTIAFVNTAWCNNGAEIAWKKSKSLGEGNKNKLNAILR